MVGVYQLDHSHWDLAQPLGHCVHQPLWSEGGAPGLVTAWLDIVVGFVGRMS